MSDQEPARYIPLFQMLGRFWTVPNALSLLRLVLVIPITYLIVVDGSLAWLSGLIMAAILSDWFDGRIARWSHTVSAWGKVLDPVADKFAALMIVSALVFRSVEPTLPGWLLALVLVRDGSIVLGGIVIAQRTGRIAVSAWIGKAAVAWLALTVLAAILKADPPVMQVCIWMTTGLMVLSFLAYLGRFFRIIRATRHRPPRATSGAAAASDDALGDDLAPDAAPSASDAASTDTRETPQSVS